MEQKRRGRPPKNKASDYSERKTAVEGMDASTDEEYILRSLGYFIEESEKSVCFQNVKKDHLEFWMMYDGNQWFDTGDLAITSEADEILINRDIVRSTVRTINPLLTDARPERHVKERFSDPDFEAMRLRQQMGLLPPEMPDVWTDGDLAKFLTEKWHANETRRMEEAELSLALLECQGSGIEWRMPFWNKPYDEHPGFLDVKNLGPLNVRIDPYSRRTDLSDARYVLIREWMDADLLQDQFRLSKSDMDEILTNNEQRISGQGWSVSYQGTVSYKQLQEQDAQGDHRQDRTGMPFRPMVEKWTCWFWGRLPAEAQEGGYAKSIRHPSGRVFHMAGNKLLSRPSPNPYWHGLFPAVPYRNNPDPTTPYGKGDIRWLKHDQMAINVLVVNVLQQALRLGSSRVIAEEGAMKGSWDADPGAVWKVNDGMIDRVKIVAGEPINPSILNLIAMFEDSSHGQMGINPTVRGESPGAQSSGVAIQNLQNAALARVREMARGLEWAYEREGYICVSNLQQFSSFREVIDRGRVEVPEFEEWRQRIRYLDYELRVESRAKYPMNVLDRLKIALQLGQLGFWDALQVLEWAELPVSERLKEKLQTAEAIEMEQAQRVLGQMRMQPAQPNAMMSVPEMPGMGGNMPPGGGMAQIAGMAETLPVPLPVGGGALTQSAPLL